MAADLRLSATVVQTVGGKGYDGLAVAGGVAGAAAGVTLTFATTYALGHAARQYYAQGRQISGDDLRALFAKLRDDAKGIYPRVESEIRAQAQHLNLQDVVARIRG